MVKRGMQKILAVTGHGIEPGHPGEQGPEDVILMCSRIIYLEKKLEAIDRLLTHSRKQSWKRKKKMRSTSNC